MLRKTFYKDLRTFRISASCLKSPSTDFSPAFCSSCMDSLRFLFRRYLGISSMIGLDYSSTMMSNLKHKGEGKFCCQIEFIEFSTTTSQITLSSVATFPPLLLMAFLFLYSCGTPLKVQIMTDLFICIRVQLFVQGYIIYCLKSSLRSFSIATVISRKS